MQRRGSGSANLIVDSTGGIAVGTAGYTGTRLDDITKLEYSTYRKTLVGRMTGAGKRQKNSNNRAN